VKRKVAQAMAPHRGTVTTNSAGRAARGERFVHLRLREAGRTFYDGPAEITALTRNLATGGVTFSWIAADASIDDWNPTTEEGSPASVGTGVAVTDLTTPTIASATATFAQDSAANTSGVPHPPGCRRPRSPRPDMAGAHPRNRLDLMGSAGI
jgi:hypothetical protein